MKFLDNFCLCNDTHKAFMERLGSIMLMLGDNRLSVTVEEWQDKGTGSQMRGYWVLMRQISNWMNEHNIREGVYIERNGQPQKIGDKKATPDFAHEMTMLKFFPSDNGKRMSLTKVIKNKNLMMFLIDSLMTYWAERGLILVLDSGCDYGYYQWKQDEVK